MLKAKDVDTNLAAMKRQMDAVSKAFETVEKGFKKFVEASNELSNQLEQIEQAQTFGALEKKAYDKEIKEWEKLTGPWADTLGGPQLGLERLAKDYNAFLK